MSSGIKFLNAKEAQDVDVELMSTLAFSIDQLMELAGSLSKLHSKSARAFVVVLCTSKINTVS